MKKCLNTALGASEKYNIQFMFAYLSSQTGRRKGIRQENDLRLRIAALAVTVVGLTVIVRLASLMIVQHGFYTALAAGTQETVAKLFPRRGEVYVQDSRTGQQYPLAINRDYFLVYADTRVIENETVAKDIAEKIAHVFSYTEARKASVLAQLQKPGRAYEPLERKVDEDTVNKLKALNLTGIAYVRKAQRYYPEGRLASQVVGFVGQDEAGQEIGRYGIEGYWQNTLAGAGGFLSGAKSSTGKWISLSDRISRPAEDGTDMLLTIDRTLQFEACRQLQAAKDRFGAASASLIIMEPKSGAIRAMCSLPDFDPNTYGQAESVAAYNNSTIFEAYEPGSIFKPIAMAAALNEGAVAPGTTFYDTGSRSEFCTRPIRNADGKAYQEQTMVGVLEKSINTGMVFVVEHLGKKRFRDYVEQFGFGVKEGIELDTEGAGNVHSLSKNTDDKIDCYTATGAFGQGLTVTPLQMVTAISAIANGGTLMRPYIVDELRYVGGRVEKTKAKQIRQVITPRVSALLRGMLVKVVDAGEGRGARVHGYYVAGKTGTAQIPIAGGYAEETNQSFVGFAPVDDPKFVMLVKLEKPNERFASMTAAPLFADITEFILQYYQVPPVR